MQKLNKPITLALSGGGVRGLAHIGLLKLLDKHNIEPQQISGTSMGAIIGALYATGLSGAEIETRIRAHIIEPSDKLKGIYKKRDKLVKWAKVFAFEKAKGGFVTANGLFAHLFDELQDIQFEDLKRPFTACATDFNSGEEVLINTGSVLNGVQASMAVPGIFAPVSVELEGEQRYLVDGGLVNNLPTNILDKGSFIIASDVMPLSTLTEPKALGVVSGAINIVVANATKLSLEKFPADYLHQIDSEGVEAFDFHKINSILKRGNDAASDAENQLLKAIEIAN